MNDVQLSILFSPCCSGYQIDIRLSFYKKPFSNCNEKN